MPRKTSKKRLSSNRLTGRLIGEGEPVALNGLHIEEIDHSDKGEVKAEVKAEESPVVSSYQSVGGTSLGRHVEYLGQEGQGNQAPVRPVHTPYDGPSHFRSES